MRAGRLQPPRSDAPHTGGPAAGPVSAGEVALAQVPAHGFGVPTRRREGAPILTGHGTYVADMLADNGLHVAVVLSLYARAAMMALEGEAGTVGAPPAVGTPYSTRWRHSGGTDPEMPLIAERP